MAKNCGVYKDKEVKRFNQVTVVKGETHLKGNMFDELTKAYLELEEASYFPYARETTGRSKCDPEDTYDAKTGLIVASRKAELKGNKYLLKDITTLRRAAQRQV